MDTMKILVMKNQVLENLLSADSDIEWLQFSNNFVHSALAMIEAMKRNNYTDEAINDVYGFIHDFNKEDYIPFRPSWNELWKDICMNCFSGRYEMRLKRVFFENLPYYERLKIYNDWRKGMLQLCLNLFQYIIDHPEGIENNRIDQLSDLMDVLSYENMRSGHWEDRFQVWDLSGYLEYGKWVMKSLLGIDSENQFELFDTLMNVWLGNTK